MATQAQTPESPAVRYAPPARRLVRMVNPVVRMLLESPLHRLLGDGLAVLRLRGRKSGRTYTFPVSWYDLNDEVFLLTAERWQVNLAEPADVELTHGGRRVRKHADIVTNPDAVARTFLRAIDACGYRRAKSRVGVQIADRDRLGFEEMAAACQRDHMIAVRLTDPE